MTRIFLILFLSPFRSQLFTAVAAYLTSGDPPARILSPRSWTRRPVNHPIKVGQRFLKASADAAVAPSKDPSEALKRLLERQKKDVEDTTRLLERLQQGDLTSYVSRGDTEADKVVATLLKGVDYGFRSRSEGVPATPIIGGIAENYGPPSNVWTVGTQQFMRNLKAMRGEYEDEVDLTLTPEQGILQAKLEALTLNSTAIWEQETAKGPISAPFIIKIPYIFLCYFLDKVFEGENVFARFFFLETVARMPYFSYIAMLHFYETLGFWRRSADVKRIHFAEEANEFHHLMIMESLGGDQRWWTRFLAQHSAIAYYFVLCILWMVSPTLSYKFSELLETHAVHTYSQLLDDNESLLRELPPSIAATDYYAFGISDPLYAEIQTDALARGIGLRNPGESMESLYDVFSAIRDDEADHVKTMQACLDAELTINSASTETRLLYSLLMAATVGYGLATPEGADVSRIEQLLGSTGDLTVGEGIIDTALAGAAGLVNLVAGSNEEGAVTETAETLEASGFILLFFEGLLKGILAVVEEFLRFLIALL